MTLTTRVYMLRNTEGGYYKSRGKYCGCRWESQQHATVWTSIKGPAAAKAHFEKRYRRQHQCSPPMTVIEIFELRYIGNYDED